MALVESQFPSLSAQQVVQLVVNNTKPLAGLSGKTITGGVVDAFNALLAGFANPTASASPSSVTGTTTALSVADLYGAGDTDLTYTWSVIAKPAGATTPIFAPNGTSGAKNTTATFYASGNYTFQATISNGDGFTRTASVSVTVNQTPTTITTNPASATVVNGGNQVFTASVVDQFGAAISPPSLTWSVNSGGVGGTINQGGTYTAPTSGVGTDTVKVASGSASATATVTVTSPSGGTFIDAGGNASGSYSADAYYTGGTTTNTPQPINTSLVTNPAPQAVYQWVRFGNPAPFSYTIPNLNPGLLYNVRLDFAEIYYNAAGLRKFNVKINGTQVLTNFDVYFVATGGNIAIAQTFTTVANTVGQIGIQFTATLDNAIINGMQITPVSGAGPAFVMGRPPANGPTLVASSGAIPRGPMLSPSGLSMPVSLNMGTGSLGATNLSARPNTLAVAQTALAPLAGTPESPHAVPLRTEDADTAAVSALVELFSSVSIPGLVIQEVASQQPHGKRTRWVIGS